MYLLRTNLISFSDKIIGFGAKENAVYIYWDFSKAFNTTPNTILIIKRTKYELD